MKKVLIITSGILPVPASRGGAAEYLTQLYIDENEKNQRFSFDVATISRPCDKRERKKYKNTNFLVVDENKLSFRFSRIFRFIINKIQPFYYIDNAFIHSLLKETKSRKDEYDLIIIENNPLYVKSLREYFKDTKIILHLHNDYLNSKTKHNRYIFENCDKILTVSNYIGDRVKTIRASNKIITLYNGIEIDNFSKSISISERTQLRVSFGLDENDFVILFAGRLVKEKGILELVQAFKKISEKYNNIKLLIVGKDAPERNETSIFEKKIRTLAASLQGKVIFTGFVKYEHMPRIYQISDISVVPSNWGEPLATTVLEGLASGISQIVTNDGGIPEEIKDTTAKIIDKNNLTNNLYDALEQAIITRPKHSRKNQALAKKRFNKTRYIADMLDLIEESANE